MVEVVALGELLIDFVSCGKSAQGNGLFEACPGGAPCNVLAMLSRLGRKTAFIGKLGDDMFGQRLKKAVEELGIDTRGIVFDRSVSTTLAFVDTGAGGERSFAFCRKPGADMMLRQEELDKTLLENCRIFHFGTLSMTHTGVREATRAAADIALRSGALISFDPNLRPPLWDSTAEAKAQIEWGCAHCDILKISDDEAEFLTGITSAKEAGMAIRGRFPNIGLIFITCGRNGSIALYRDLVVCAEAFRFPNTIDTTGAGDTFCGCCLDAVLGEGLGNLTIEKILKMLRFASAAAGIVTTRKGALSAMPERHEILECVKSAPGGC
ncbi:MAG: carbohydrate kinase [Clostridiales bacterium]|nr:carbohydrate kinase [Clostridiales bacterium]